MNIVILAAGQGRRMRSARPKVLQPLAGRPMLAHVIDTARALAGLLPGAPAARIVVVVGHGAPAVRAAFAAEPDLVFVDQPTQLGTGHAVLQAAPQLRAEHPTLVLYGDVPLLRASTLAALAAQAGDALALLTVCLTDPTGYGRIVRDGQGKVRCIVEEADADTEQRRITEVNTGILAAPTPRLLAWLEGLSNANAQGEYYLTDVVAAARAECASVCASVLADADEALGVNDRSQLARAERLVQQRTAQALMAAGATLADPQRLDVRGVLQVEQDVFIDVGCVFEGAVTLGEGVRVGPHCVVRDSVLGPATVVHAFSHIDGAQVGPATVIGPYARLRPGARLDDGVHVGNFVEIKAARLGAGAKANHLAYVGDADVGARSNIGAGTIFANYDGADKHHTDVGADVHIGSNSVLVAPVRVGAGATVGAGSTITREVPPGKLTVGRARQVTLDGWRRPVKKS